MEIDALILTTHDPQIDRCIESVEKQTVPFARWFVIRDIVPQSKAYNEGMSLVKGDWVLKIDGDTILYPNAVEIITPFIFKKAENVATWNFTAHDSFMNMRVGCMPLLSTAVYKPLLMTDCLRNDRVLGKVIMQMGLSCPKKRIDIGTHFGDPDEFQVFRRFYIAAKKLAWWSSRHIRVRLENRLKETGNSLYQLAIEAFEFGVKKNIYPGSHNIDFDKKMFEEFNKKHEGVS